MANNASMDRFPLDHVWVLRKKSSYAEMGNVSIDFGLAMVMMIVGITPMKTLLTVPRILANPPSSGAPMAGVFSILGNATMKMTVVIARMNRIVITRVAHLASSPVTISGVFPIAKSVMVSMIARITVRPMSLWKLAKIRM